MTIKLTPRKKMFVDTASEMFGAAAVLTKAETKEAAAKAKADEERRKTNEVQKRVSSFRIG